MKLYEVAIHVIGSHVIRLRAPDEETAEEYASDWWCGDKKEGDGTIVSVRDETEGQGCDIELVDESKGG